MKVLIFIHDIFKKFPFLLIANTFLLLMVNLIDMASLFSLIVVVDLFIKQDLQSISPITKYILAAVKFIGLPDTLGWVLVLFLFFTVLKITFQIFTRYLILKTKYAVLRDIILGTFDDFFNARWYFFSSAKQGTLLNTFIREITVVGDAFGAMAEYFSTILQVILYLLLPFYLSWQITSISIIVALFFALPFFILGKISYRLGKLNTSTANEAGSVIQESLSLAKIILGFANQRKSIEAYASAFDEHRRVTLKSQTLTQAIPLIYYPLGILVLVIGLLISRRLSLPLSETIVLFYSLSRIIPYIGNLTAQKNCLDNFFPSYEQIMNLRHSAKELRQPTGTRIFRGFNKEIIINNLSFAYPAHRPIFTDINMHIPKGKMVGIVGESGVGKSTLIDMIMGFHKPAAGQITFDGISLQEFEINSYRRRIGYVPQDSVLFNMTIRDNLRWANESANEDKIQQACQQANAEEFIKKFPHGYDTIVGDRGIRLSGGQIQRIALARAILRKPELLILDEATSALDTHSERLIQEALENITKETTVIVVAHRLSTIINANYIYMLKDGCVREEGTYLELIQMNGDFNQMMQLQALGER